MAATTKDPLLPAAGAAGAAGATASSSSSPEWQLPQLQATLQLSVGFPVSLDQDQALPGCGWRSCSRQAQLTRTSVMPAEVECGSQSEMLVKKSQWM